MLCCRVECWKMSCGHLAVLGLLLLLPQGLAENHVCPRTEMVKTRVAVPIQEPVTFRSYTWCLKMPPRCSKYTVITRERVTYETEVRNKTVVECCKGYNSLYGVCVPSCETCVNMRCITGNCTCAPGYRGPKCSQTCESGRWGNECSETCTCRVGEDCDPQTGSCSPSTSTTPPPPPSTAASTNHHPTVQVTINSLAVPTTVAPITTIKSPLHGNSHTARKLFKNIPTPNIFVDLTLTQPTTSTEDLTDFNVIYKPRTNDSVSLIKLNNDEKSLNALSDVDYPVLPTEGASESFSFEHDRTNTIVVNSLNGNSSMVNDRWISEFGAHSGVTLGSALALIALLIITVSGLLHWRNKQSNQHESVLPVNKTSLRLMSTNSHYAVPAPPPFSFSNGYSELDLTSGTNEDTYDHPRSIRCLAANEPVYDELRY